MPSSKSSKKKEPVAISRKKQRQEARLKKKERKRGNTNVAVDAGFLSKKRKECVSFQVESSQTPSLKKKLSHLEALAVRKGLPSEEDDGSHGKSMNPGPPRMPTQADPLLARDDAEIAYLERKLGLRGGRSSAGGKSKLAREYEDDGLGEDFVSFLESLDTVVRSNVENPSLSGRRDTGEGVWGENREEGGEDEEEAEEEWDQAAFEKERDDAFAHLPTDDEEEEDEEDQDSVDDDFFAERSGVLEKKIVRFNSDQEDANSLRTQQTGEVVDDEVSGNGARVETESSDDDVIASADPLIAREDAEIAYLERKLGMGGSSSSKKQKEKGTGGRSRVYDEMDANEFGDGFGTFLQELDEMSAQIRKHKRPPSSAAAISKQKQQQNIREPSEGSSVVAIYDDANCDDGFPSNEEDDWSSSQDGESDGGGDDDDDVKRRGKDVMTADVEVAGTDVYRPTLGQDIYGRSTAPVDGAVVAQKYVPPAARRERQEQQQQQQHGATAVVATETAERAEHLSRLRRKVTGCLNRLAESSLEAVATDLLQLFVQDGSMDSKKKKKKTQKEKDHAPPHYAAADVTEALTSGLLKACVSDTQVLKGLVPSAAALVCALHALLKDVAGGRGGELFGAAFIETVATELQAAMAEDKKWSSAAMAADDGKRSTKRLAAGEGGDEEEESKLFELSSKRCVNLVLLVASLYSLGLVQCHLVFGLVKALLVPQVKNDDDDANGELRPLDLELLLVLLRESGPRLRADDPTAIKDITAMVREAGAKSSEKDSRVRFLEAELERLNKQGKKTKHSSGSSKTSRTLLMDPDSIARMRKLIQRICKSKGPSSASSSSLPSSTSGGLHMSWDDLVNAETRGRWWRTGASWLQAGKDAGSTAGLPSQASDHGRKAAARASLSAAASGEGADVAAAAARQRMNTDARRAAFGAIMGAESVDDALQKLADSNKSFRGTQGREVCRVLVECCGAEAGRYNPYYAALAKRLCLCGEGDHRFTLQLCYWDLFKTLGDVPARRAANLACMLASLVAQNCLSLANTLKPVDVVTLSADSPVALLFFKKFVLSLILASKSPPVQSGGGPSSEEDPLSVACSSLGATKETLLVRDQLAVFLSQHVKAPPDSADSSSFIERRKCFKRCLRDAQLLHESVTKAKQRHRALKQSGKKGKGGNNANPTDIDGSRPDDDWAMFYGK